MRTRFLVTVNDTVQWEAQSGPAAVALIDGFLEENGRRSPGAAPGFLRRVRRGVPRVPGVSWSRAFEYVHEGVTYGFLVLQAPAV